MLRWPSGVTAIMQLAVVEPCLVGGVTKVMPWADMDFAKTAPKRSSNTLPTNRPCTVALQRGQPLPWYWPPIRPAKLHAASFAERLAVIRQRLVQFLGAKRINQVTVMPPLAMRWVRRKRSFHPGNDIHNGIAQSGDIVFLLSCSFSPLSPYNLPCLTELASDVRKHRPRRAAYFRASAMPAFVLRPVAADPAAVLGWIGGGGNPSWPGLPILGSPVSSEPGAGIAGAGAVRFSASVLCCAGGGPVRNLFLDRGRPHRGAGITWKSRRSPKPGPSGPALKAGLRLAGWCWARIWHCCRWIFPCRDWGESKPVFCWPMAGCCGVGEYFELAALRHLAVAEVDALRKSHGWQVWAAASRSRCGAKFRPVGSPDRAPVRHRPDGASVSPPCAGAPILNSVIHMIEPPRRVAAGRLRRPRSPAPPPSWAPTVPLPKPPPAHVEPPGFTGLTPDAFADGRARPLFSRKDGATEMWRYDASACHAFFFFTSGAVTHVETIPRGGIAFFSPIRPVSTPWGRNRLRSSGDAAFPAEEPSSCQENDIDRAPRRWGIRACARHRYSAHAGSASDAHELMIFFRHDVSEGQARPPAHSFPAPGPVPVAETRKICVSTAMADSPNATFKTTLAALFSHAGQFFQRVTVLRALCRHAFRSAISTGAMIFFALPR